MFRSKIFHNVTKKSPIIFSPYLQSRLYRANHTPTAEQTIQSNVGLAEFINKTYLYTGGSIVASLGIGALTGGMCMNFSMETLISGAILAIGGSIGLGMTNPIVHREKSKYYSTNPLSRQLAYGSLVTGIGLMMGPAMVMAEMSQVLIPSIFMTSMIFVGASVYARSCKTDSLLVMGPALYGGLFGLIGCGLIAVVSPIFFGPSNFALMFHTIDLYAGVPLFTGFIAYDTHVAIAMYNKGNADHLGCSAQLYLDFINILIRLMEILAKAKRK